MLDIFYEGYGFDNENPLLWTMKLGKELQDKNIDGYSTEGMKTLSNQGVLSYNPNIDVVDANKYTEVGQFISENGANYSDLRWPVCGCGD